MKKSTRNTLLAALAILVGLGGAIAAIETSGHGFTGVARDRAEDANAMRLETVGMALTAHYLREGRYPEALTDLAEPALRPADLVDSWGNALRYVHLGPRSFDLCSAGADGAFGTADDLCENRRPASARSR
ncbi:MAG: hypothetical protein EP329_07045 [Deltaproteobacteria bacterium]|nr:MAG: hypothetical protein EP329_07045 [Deltaproteobacteria bacterium]